MGGWVVVVECPVCIAALHYVDLEAEFLLSTGGVSSLAWSFEK